MLAHRGLLSHRHRAADTFQTLARASVLISSSETLSDFQSLTFRFSGFLLLTRPGLADGLSPHNGLIRVFHSYSQNSNRSLQQMKEESLRSQHKISCWVFQGNFSVSTGRKLADFWCFTWTKVLLMSLPG